MFRLAKTLHLPVFVVEKIPASEILEWRAIERIESKEHEDAVLVSKGKPPKHYKSADQVKQLAKKQQAAWINAFDI